VGTLFQPPGATSGVTVTITMASGAGTAAYALPTVGCQAILTVTGVVAQSTQVQFAEKVTVDPQGMCAPAARLTLTLGGNQRAGQRQLTANWQDAANQNNIATGTLAQP
jgi:hypothetical protein